MSDDGNAEKGNRPRTVQEQAVIFGCAIAVAIIFVSLGVYWLTLWNQFVAIFTLIQPEQIRDFVLMIYFVSWILAMIVDLLVQAHVYRQAQTRDELVKKGLGIAVVLLLVGLSLIWSRKSSANFTLVLTIFFMVNVIAWRQTRRLVRPLINSSFKYYEGRDETGLKLKELQAVDSYIGGQWQRHRFLLMFFILLLLNFTLLSLTGRADISRFLRNVGLDMPIARIDSLLPDAIIALFVVVAETWSWVKRIGVAVNVASPKRRYFVRDHERFTELMAQFLDQQFKTANYLLIAHGAALAGVLTFIKEPKNTGMNAGSLGALPVMFGVGFVTSMLAYIMLSVAQSREISDVLQNLRTGTALFLKFAWYAFFVSALLLIVGILNAAGRLSGA